VSTTDVNRNNVSNDWYERSKAEWLWWIDADNPPPLGALRRLLQLEKPLVSGLYYGGHYDTEVIPINYIRNKKGAYHPLSAVYEWEKGEILQVDTAGMGCFLTHRDVYTDIMKTYKSYQRVSGGYILLSDDQIQGEIPEDPTTHPYAGKVKDGLYYESVIQIAVNDPKYPFFMCQYGRTEDMVFCEMARELGYEIWIDTSVEVGHVRDYEWDGSHFRDNHGRPSKHPMEIVYVE